MMNEGQDGPTPASRADHRHRTPESVLFINTVVGPEASQASIRKKARSHIMTRYHKKAREMRGVERPPHDDTVSFATSGRILDGEQSQPVVASSVPIHRIGPATADFDLQIRSHVGNLGPLHGLREREERLNSILGRTISDPSRFDLFGTVSFPFQLDHRDQNLLFHYCTVFNYTNMPVNSKEEWIKFAVTDAALLHTTLVISALHVALLRGQEFSVDAFRHQGAAVNILNNRLNDPILSSTDSTILSISCLALIDILNASPLGAAPHITALEQLVNHRGGLNALGFNGIVRRKALWADLSSAIAQRIAPRFPFSSEKLAMECSSDDTPIIVNTSTTKVCTEVSKWVAGCQYPSGIEAIIDDLQRLSLVLSSVNRADMAEIDQLMLSDHFYNLERRTYDLLLHAETGYSFTQTVPKHSAGIIPTDSLYIACCLTAIIYVSLALREIPPRAGIFSPLLGRLTTILRDIDISAVSTTYPETLLWILGTGGAAALGREERRLYVKWLDYFCRAQHIYDWDAMKDAFSRSIHLTPRYIMEFMDVWNDVEESRIMRDLIKM